MKLATGKIDITPTAEHEPFYLLGHAMRKEQALGITNRIYCRSMVFHYEDKKMVWLSLELGGLTKLMSESISSAIQSKHNIDENHIIISFTHTHSGPEFRSGDKRPKHIGPLVDEYSKFVESKVAEVVELTLKKNPVSVKAKFKATEIDGFYGNRNGVTEREDKSFVNIHFYDENEKVVGTVVNFACHPTVLGPQNFYLDSDLTGYISRYYEEKYDANCFVMVGAAGNMSNRQYRQGNDLAELKRVGEGILSQVEANEDWQEVAVDSLSVEEFHYNRVFEIDRQEKEEMLIEAEKKIANAKTFDEKKIYLSAQAFLKIQTENFEPEFKYDLDCVYLKVGDIRLFTIPAELFAEFGLEIKEVIGGKLPLIWGYTRFNNGYLYNGSEDGTNYESIMSNLPQGTTEDFVSEAIEFIKNN